MYLLHRLSTIGTLPYTGIVKERVLIYKGFVFIQLLVSALVLSKNECSYNGFVFVRGFSLLTLSF